MAERRKLAATDAALIWERPERARRPVPAPLSREGIVSAAVAIADAEGLASVSLRKVAAALDAGPMRLYGHVSTKAELLDLMVDAVYGEMRLAEPAPASWRPALRSIAHGVRQAARRHGWFIDLMGGRPHQGPNALAHLEASLAAVCGAPGFEAIDTVMQVCMTVNAYVIGAVQSEAAERLAERESGLDKRAWQIASAPYIQRMIATGRFPMIEKVVSDATHPSPDTVFEQGLECILDGIEARLSR